MRDDLIAWTHATAFSGEQAALAIVGEPPGGDLARAEPVLALLRQTWEQTCQWFSSMAVPNTRPRALLVSIEMQEQLDVPDPEFKHMPGVLNVALQVWLRSAGLAVFERQHFRPGALAQWLHEAEKRSVYSFAPEPGGRHIAANVPLAGSTQDLGMLATRAQLIEAFGSFTGMKIEWFSNLKDSPALREARKVRGQGGRGHIMEPYFCPLEVMQWLTSAQQKKGRQLSEAKGWELLERHFPRVYAANECADPRT